MSELVGKLMGPSFGRCMTNSFEIQKINRHGRVACANSGFSLFHMSCTGFRAITKSMRASEVKQPKTCDCRTEVLDSRTMDLMFVR